MLGCGSSTRATAGPTSPPSARRPAPTIYLERAELFDTVEQAVADLDLLFATTARAHDQAKPVMGPQAAAQEIAAHVGGGAKEGIMPASCSGGSAGG